MWFVRFQILQCEQQSIWRKLLVLSWLYSEPYAICTSTVLSFWPFLHGRRKVHDYFLLLICKSSIWFTEQHIFKIILHFFNTSKCAANYVISFEVYDGFICQKILKQWRQESRPFSPGSAPHIPYARYHNPHFLPHFWRPKTF